MGPFHFIWLIVEAPRQLSYRTISTLSFFYNPDMPAGLGPIVVQIDGLAYPRVCESFARGRLPNLARWCQTGNSRLIEVDGGVPSQTSSAQAVLLYGAQQPPPGFRWYDRLRRQACVSKRPADLRHLESAWAPEAGLLNGGAAITTAWRAGAAQWAFVLSEGVRLSNARAMSPTGLQWVRFPPWFGGTPLTAWLRAVLVAAILDALTCRAVARAIQDGVSPIYATLLGYDQVAHHAGLDAPLTAWALVRTDLLAGHLERAARQAGYGAIVALSDHGLSPGTPFARQRGMSLAAIIGRLSGLGHRSWHVAPSGNLAHVYARDESALKCLHSTADLLSREPGIGLTLTRDGRARGRLGSHDLRLDQIEGADPITPYDGAMRRAMQLNRLRQHPDAGDLIVLGEVDTAGHVVPFEDQFASHGGLGGDQTRAFALWPSHAPLAIDEPISLAELRSGLVSLADPSKPRSGEADPK